MPLVEPPTARGFVPGVACVGADALYRRFEHDTFRLGWPVFSKLMHHAGGSTDAGDAGRLFLMPGFRIPFWPKPSSDRRTPRYLWRSSRGLRGWLGVVAGGRACDRPARASACADRTQRARQRLRPHAAVRHQYIHAQGRCVAHPVRYRGEHGQSGPVRHVYEAASQRSDRPCRHGMVAARAAGAAGGA